MSTTTAQSAVKVAFDKQDQLAQIQGTLLPGETLYAVYDCTGAGTGFVAVTNFRVILQDKSFVGKMVAVTSVPYRQVQSISIVSNKSAMGSFFSSGSLAITAGGKDHVAEFRGTEKVKHIHDVVMHHLLQVR